MRLSRRGALHAGAGKQLDVTKLAITYTGTMTDSIVTMSGVQYRLLALTSSGTLSVESAVNADICVVGGGCGGVNARAAYYGQGGAGGAGAFMKNQAVSAFAGGTATIGAGGSAGAVGGETSLGGVTSGVCSTTYDGGSGGGQPGHNARSAPAAGTGDGLSKYPFGDSGYFAHPHCGGGGGGGFYLYDSDGTMVIKDGGEGGTNGGDGGNCTDGGSGTFGAISASGGTGGAYGGANGGTTQSKASTAASATYYGSGGGGGAGRRTTGNTNGSGGAGYQGIIYVRIPLDQAA